MAALVHGSPAVTPQSGDTTPDAGHLNASQDAALPTPVGLSGSGVPFESDTDLRFDTSWRY